MSKQEPEALTNEKLVKKFKSQFELVNYAIRLAENIIKTGREPNIKRPTQNRAMQVLEEIIEGTDHFTEIPVIVEERRERPVFDKESFPLESFKKAAERKKSRKILAK